MSSYTDIFGGNVVSPAYVNYSTFALTALNSPLTLVWPLQFTNGTDVVSQIIDVTSDATRSMVMPDATLVSVGQSVLFSNVGGNTVNVYENDGATLLATLPSATATYIYLIDNSTSNGSWRQIPWGGGVPAVISVAAVSTSPDLIITGSPITNAGTFTFSFTGVIDNLINIAGTGVVCKTGATTFATRTLTGTVNQIVISNGDGVAANPTFALASAVSGINSLTASNVRIAVAGTNIIDTVDNNPLAIGVDLAINNDKNLIFYDVGNAHFAAFKAPTAYSTSAFYTLPLAPPPISGYTLTSTVAGIMSWAPSNPGGVTSLTGTPDRITVSAATGAVQVDIAGTYAGQNTIITLGTVTTGTWNANTITVPYGGTGLTTTTAYGVITGGTTATAPFQNAGTGAIGQVLQGQGASALPIWGNVPGLNRVINGDFQIWQAATSFTGTFITPPLFVADRWSGGNPGAGAPVLVISRQNGATTNSYVCRVQRQAGDATAGTPSLGQTLLISQCIGTAGLPLSLSFKAKAGANFSSVGDALSILVYSGTGTTDVDFFIAGFTGQIVQMNTSFTLTGSMTSFNVSCAAIPANVTQLFVQFYWTAPAVAAGANDYFDITDVQLEASASPSAYQRLTFNEELKNCLPYYRKSFLYATAPTQNVGAATGEFNFIATKAGAVQNNSNSIIFDIPMRITPAMTLYNPSAANGQIRNESAAADFSGSNTYNVTANGIQFYGTGSGGTAVGDICGVHWVADARL